MQKKWLYYYSPPEKKLGVIYSSLHGRKRFKCFVTEDEHIWLGTLTHSYLLKEIPLGPRTAYITLSNVLTKDRVYLDLELKVFYRVDPRNAADENLIQVINMPNSAFEGPVRTHTEERIRNEIFPQFTANEALSHQGRKNIRKAISSLVAERVKGFGIAVNPSFGAAIMNMQPNAIYQRALQEESAAESQGNAVYKRVAPTLQKIEMEEMLQVLYAHLASTMTKTGTMPSTFYTSQPPANPEQNIIENKDDEGEPQAKKRRPYKYPIAAD